MINQIPTSPVVILLVLLSKRCTFMSARSKPVVIAKYSLPQVGELQERLLN